MITIMIRETANGVECSAVEDQRELANDTGVRVSGMLSIASISFMTGRWGVKDAEGMNCAWQDMFRQYREALQRTVAQGVSRANTNNGLER